MRVIDVAGILLSNADYDMVVLSLERGRWEDVSRIAWASLCEALPAHAVIWDIGAYSGYYALLAAKHSQTAHIYAVEPNPSLLPTLKNNISINNSNINVINCAVTDTSGTVDLNITNDISMPSGSSIVDIGKPIKRKVSIRAITGDELAKQTNEYPDLIKIDVEGAELKVLAGMTELLKLVQPTMLIEILSEDVLAEVLTFLKPYNYAFQRIDENPYSLDTGSFSPTDRNYLFYQR